MRNIKEVIDKIINEIPTDLKDLIDALNRLKIDTNLRAPELDFENWNELHDIIFSYINIDNQYLMDYELNIISIFTTKSISEIKHHLNLLNK